MGIKYTDFEGKFWYTHYWVHVFQGYWYTTYPK